MDMEGHSLSTNIFHNCTGNLIFRPHVWVVFILPHQGVEIEDLDQASTETAGWSIDLIRAVTANYNHLIWIRLRAFMLRTRML
jgi:hypothetical protein